MRLGDESAHRALLVYREGLKDLESTHSRFAEVLVPEVRRLTEAFVRSHAGAVEIAHVKFWPEWPTSRTAVQVARGRLDLLLGVLEND